MFYAQIVPLQPIPFPQPQVFTYQTDKNLKIGQIVLVPFRNRQIFGIVLELKKTPPANIKLKKIISAPCPFALLTKTQIKLAYFTADYYHQPLSLVFKTIVPTLPKKIENLLKKHSFVPNYPQLKTNPTKTKPQIILAPGLFSSQSQKFLLKNISKALKQKRQIAYLVPEISQVLPVRDKLEYFFPQVKIAVFTSHIPKQKYFIAYLQTLMAEAQIILGTRQAIFAPILDKNLIIIDNQHNNSYKQSEMKPYYDARVVAQERARLTNSKLFFVSASPTVNLWHQAQKEKLKIYRPSQDFDSSLIIDMRRELTAGNYSIFSYPLLKDLKNVLTQNKQALIYVSRHGEYKFVMCRDCGFVLTCPHCKISLTQFNNQRLICPLCSFSQPTPPTCPNCRSTRLKGFGVGVKQVEKELKKIFNSAKITAFTADILTSRRKLAKIYQQFDTSQIDILVGSQTILNWQPINLGLVAAINIDSSLFTPHYLASEQAFGLLTQIFSFPVKKIIQTYNPENQILHWAKNFNYQDFFKQEIKLRQALGYPPFSQLIKLQNKNNSLPQTEKQKEEIKKILEAKIRQIKEAEKIKIIALPIKKIGNQFVFNLLIKIKQPFDRKKLKLLLNDLPPSWSIDVDPKK